MRILRDVVDVGGPDAAGFLQGQLSQDVEGLAPGGFAWALVLQPQGKVDAWIRVHRRAPDTFLLDVDEGHGAALVARLERFKLRVDASMSLAGARPCEIDPSAASPLAAIGPPVDEPAEGPLATPAEWDALRVRLGIPAMGRELTADTIPEEAGVVDASVSFTKGCYTGQELVARVDSRGRNVPRRLRRVELDRPDAHLDDGAELRLGDKVVGVVTTGGAGTALAYVGRAVQPGAAVETPAGMARLVALAPLR